MIATSDLSICVFMFHQFFRQSFNRGDSHESLRFRISFFEMARHMNGSKKSASASPAWSQPRTSRDSMQFFEKFRRVRAALATENQRFNRHFNGQFDFQESAISPNHAESDFQRTNFLRKARLLTDHHVTSHRVSHARPLFSTLWVRKF